MTISSDDDLMALKEIGGIVARVLKAMAAAIEPGMTTAELDSLGRRLLEAAGAQSAPEITYGFPGATCISVNEEVAHGIPGDRVIVAGDLVNIDVSAEKDGYFADTGGSFAVPPVSPRVARLCQDGRRAMWQGIQVVRPGRRLNRIGDKVERFARQKGYTIIRNLASHGTGRALHEEPECIPTWRDRTTRASSRKGWCLPSNRFCRPVRSGPRRAAMAGPWLPHRTCVQCNTNTPWLRHAVVPVILTRAE